MVIQYGLSTFFSTWISLQMQLNWATGVLQVTRKKLCKFKILIKKKQKATLRCYLKKLIMWVSKPSSSFYFEYKIFSFFQLERHYTPTQCSSTHVLWLSVFINAWHTCCTSAHFFDRIMKEWWNLGSKKNAVASDLKNRLWITFSPGMLFSGMVFMAPS